MPRKRAEWKEVDFQPGPNPSQEVEVVAQANRKSSTAIQYLDRPPLGWFALDVRLEDMRATRH